jgi:hypothetical protein
MLIYMFLISAAIVQHIMHKTKEIKKINLYLQQMSKKTIGEQKFAERALGKYVYSSGVLLSKFVQLAIRWQELLFLHHDSPSP